MKHILSIAYTEDCSNFDQVIDFFGEKVRLTQYSTNFDFDLTLSLLERFDGLCDAICLSGLPPVIKGKKSNFSHPEREKLMNTTRETHVLDGQIFKDIYIPWVIRKYCYQKNHLFKNKEVSLYCGALQQNLLEVMEDLASQLYLADPYFVLKLPYIMKGTGELDRFVNILKPILKRKSIKRTMFPSFKINSGRFPKFLNDFFNADVFVANMATLELIDTTHLRNKTVIVDVLNKDMELTLREAGVTDIMVCLPQVEGIPFFNFAIFEALLQTVQKENQKLDADDILKWIDRFDIKPEFINCRDQIIQLNQSTHFHYFS